jgi:hypothetical protein
MEKGDKNNLANLKINSQMANLYEMQSKRYPHIEGINTKNI